MTAKELLKELVKCYFNRAQLFNDFLDKGKLAKKESSYTEYIDNEIKTSKERLFFYKAKLKPCYQGLIRYYFDQEYWDKDVATDFWEEAMNDNEEFNSNLSYDAFHIFDTYKMLDGDFKYVEKHIRPKDIAYFIQCVNWLWVYKLALNNKLKTIVKDQPSSISELLNWLSTWGHMKPIDIEIWRTFFNEWSSVDKLNWQGVNWELALFVKVLVRTNDYNEISRFSKRHFTIKGRSIEDKVEANFKRTWKRAKDNIINDQEADKNPKIKNPKVSKYSKYLDSLRVLTDSLPENISPPSPTS